MFRIFALLLTLFSFSCFASVERIAIVGAMDVEIEGILPKLTNVKHETIGNHIFYIGELNKKPVIVTKSGVGKVNAALTTTLLATKFNITSIIFTGIAGACSPGLEPMDVVISTALIQHDVDLTAFGNPIGLLDGYKNREFLPSESLVNQALEAAHSVLGEDKVTTGTIVSGDQFIADKKKVAFLYQEFQAKAVEMEGAALAQVADKFNIPYVVIRTISDKADGSASLTYDEMKNTTAHNSVSILLEMFK
ncbi:5'-methylthioadenosine/adenosylhomocysteine nucleosidase [Vibrio sp. Y2-5]|uniref:5'-methylthioadenosine/adenosylhomocysteine nucleosidase n=1 Tax=Vibrio sp. Y2-5 TaxID=2743977 RepID=UPI001661192A|nr:5'-methylthioadenosine/adenosylhomocysteine nucleosidase [Vibrio sp. Y2-5]MBD0788344.1 5'-methylthioadenosine/adenosylhomocysteine nucleosidase [Vibrio sp. Y2-5]